MVKLHYTTTIMGIGKGVTHIGENFPCSFSTQSKGILGYNLIIFVVLQVSSKLLKD